METIRVLFVCVHNSARSQMAEAYLNDFGMDQGFVAESAGLEAGVLNPIVVEAMGLDGYDISGNQTKSVFDFYKEGRLYQYVITVCDQEAAQRCPIFPGLARMINWSFRDPSALTGTHEEKLKATLEIRDEIKAAVLDLIETMNQSR